MRTVGRALVVALACALAAADEDLIPLPLRLPRSAYVGNLEERQHPPGLPKWPEDMPKLPLVPRGIAQLALKKPVTASGRLYSGSLAMVTDGVKEAYEDTYIELAPRLQWVQIDLGDTHKLYDICLWHNHTRPAFCHEVVVQVSDDPDFRGGVTTLFSNDRDNASGLGKGTDAEYWESNQGLLVDCHGLSARFVRCYSHGSTTLGDHGDLDDGMFNTYTEVEVWGLPQ